MFVEARDANNRIRSVPIHQNCGADVSGERAGDSHFSMLTAEGVMARNDLHSMTQRQTGAQVRHVTPAA